MKREYQTILRGDLDRFVSRGWYPVKAERKCGGLLPTVLVYRDMGTMRWLLYRTGECVKDVMQVLAARR